MLLRDLYRRQWRTSIGSKFVQYGENTFFISFHVLNPCLAFYMLHLDNCTRSGIKRSCSLSLRQYMCISFQHQSEPIAKQYQECNGNSTEYCGGTNRLNVYTARQISPDTWNAIGCYTDSVGQRTLSVRQFPAGDLTTESCVAACRSAGYFYAGTEYAGECYCDNAFRNGGGPAPDGDVGCNMACLGNRTQTCGGADRLNMYQFGNGPSSTSSTAPTEQPTGQPTFQPTDTPATTSSPTSVPVATALPTGWTYKGCWIDNINGRIMGTQLSDDNQMTIESCVARCINLGYTVAGMQYATQCFCDDFLRRGATPGPESDCNMNCAGNANEKCGAGNRDSVYSSVDGPLTVYPVPAVQTSGLGNFKYLGCYRDDAQQRALPYFMNLPNNTANNCIQQCAVFGYNAGGVEYGKECYCGDLRDIGAAGVGPAPEEECDTTCAGNVTSICGGARRLSVYTWNGPSLTTWNYASGNAAGAYEFLIGGVVVPLITQATRTGKVTFMEKSGTGAINTTGAYELDLAQINNFTGAWRPMHVKTDIFCSASITLPDKVGRQLNVGGWALDSTFGVRLYWPDGSPGVWGKNDWQENVNTLKLQRGRWYPTAMVMANGSILVIGGEQGSNGAPQPNLEILPNAGAPVYLDWLERTDPNNLYPFMAVLPSGGIFVQYYNEALIMNEKTFATIKQLPNTPAAVDRPDGGRTYPLEGTAVLLPQVAPYTDPLEVLICGGSTPFQGYALDNCVSIAPDTPNANWTIERMPSLRVLVCMTALPDGTYLILNGAQQGFAGFGLAQYPNLNAVLYDPKKPLGNRFTVMANTTVPRMYHSEAILLDDGRVLVSGSDPLDDRFGEEYRVEVFVPPYLMGNPPRPVVSFGAASPSTGSTTPQTDWKYGNTYTFTSDSAVSKVSIMGVGGSTHGNSMGQRTMLPAFTCAGTTCQVTAPPNAHICPPGWYQVFVFNSAGTPAMAQWVRIGGDPADLGSWPNIPNDFTVPGSG
ncbi:DUF1929-domain-containing protein [Byssothecium circinans]|uniref:DUF1929-domain-containing protein n=1 Tax=Byssothecium circinans TaxID=147558 RepID=A0A6A5TCA5_9PLEO|nr:DUF1929-domain-containing protein [Byssothecium circinans]